VDEAHPRVAVAMNATLVAFRVSKPAFEVEVVLGEIRVVTSHKQAWLKTRQYPTHVLPSRIVTPLELLPQGLKLGVTLGTWATVRRKRVLDRPHVGHVVAYGLVRIVHRRQTSVDVAGQTRQSFMS